MSKNTLSIVMLAAFAGLVIGCRDDDELAGTGQLKMYLVNAPASYDSVVIVVKEISVCSERQGWIVVNNVTRTFNLLAIKNGAPLLLGETSLEAGTYTQVRVVPDTGSYVVVSGRRNAITMPSGFEAGITLVHRFQVEANLPNTLYMDFDANGNACVCRCCDQFTSSLHASMNLEMPGNYVQPRLNASKGMERCRCTDRWDHRQQNGLYCRHCESNKRSVWAIG